jgi:hypothetical protein
MSVSSCSLQKDCLTFVVLKTKTSQFYLQMLVSSCSLQKDCLTSVVLKTKTSQLDLQMSVSSCSLQKDCSTSVALALALGRVSSSLMVLHDDTRLLSKHVIKSFLPNWLLSVLWFYLYCLVILKMASSVYQCTLIKNSRRIVSLQPGFFCSYPRIALFALSRIDTNHLSSATWEREVTECDQTESDKSRHYAILESDKTLFGMR